MKNLNLDEIITEAINNFSKNNISLEGIIEYIDFYKKIEITKTEIIDFIRGVKNKGMNYQNKLDLIKVLLDNFYENQIAEKFENEEQEFNENKNIKTIIKEIIIAVYNDKNIIENERIIIIRNFLILLAENTGCVEDTRIAKEILDELFEKYKIITQKDIDIFYENSSMGRWL
jgi:hypothetical protein